MAYYFQPSSNGQSGGHGHHGGRSRRQPRLSSQNSQRSFRGVRSMKELSEPPVSLEYVTKWEAARSFDLDDDLEFCPGLLTDEDLQSINSGSDRSSMSSNSPDSSPLQLQIQPTQSVTPTFSLSSTASSLTSNYHNPTKIYQPAATRVRNPIAIVNPETKMRLSPPLSTSPNRQQQIAARRW